MIDQCATRLRFVFHAHNVMLEEVAKYRAARALWARLMRDDYGAQSEAAQKLRFHAQTAGCTLHAQQPEVNLIRVACQALAAVLGGCQSLHTNSMDETLALPSEHAVTLALRTQQVLAHETGIAQVVDPLGGSYCVESLTRELQAAARDYFDRIAAEGGMLAAIENGFFRREIAQSAYQEQARIDRGEQIIVGVNAFQQADERPLPTHGVDPSAESAQREALLRIRRQRSAAEVRAALDDLRRAAEDGTNVFVPLLAAAEARVTVQEAMDALADVFGRYRIAGGW